MFKGTVSTTSTASTNIPITPVLNTNQNTKYDSTNNVIQILQGGYYDINVMLNVTSATTGDVTLGIFANGTAMAEASNRQTLATGDDYTFTSVNTIKVLPTDSGTANISIQFDVGSQVINNGVVTVERRK